MGFTQKLCCAIAVALLLLPSCSDGIVDPIGDLEEIEEWAPVLSEEEADALFGAAETQYASLIDYPWLYYAGDYRVTEKERIMTVYRFNCETGESEYACQDPVCTHDEESGCPFENYRNFGSLSTIHGGVLYTTQRFGGNPLEWYDPATAEHRELVPDADNYYVVGGELYFDRVEFSEEAAAAGENTFAKQLWRYDWEAKSATLVAETLEAYDVIEPVFAEGEERILLSSSYDFAGNFSEEQRYLYWIDPTTGERTPVLDYGIYGGTIWATGHWFCYREDTYHLTLEEDSPFYLHLVDLETGEDKVVDEDCVGLEFVIPTDRYLLVLNPDPTGENMRILRCYDLEKGEWAKEYPLSGEYDASLMRYYRGRLYFLSSWKTFVDDPEKAEIFGYLQWDILTGRQRLLCGERVFLPEISAE